MASSATSYPFTVSPPPSPGGIPGIHRDADPESLFLRTNTDTSPDFITTTLKERKYAASTVAESSVGTRTESIFSKSHKLSTMPTSAGSGYPFYYKGYHGDGKGNAVPSRTSSMTATHGSGSGSEGESAAREQCFFAVGGQFGVTPTPMPRPNCRKRPKRVKPVIHQLDQPSLKRVKPIVFEPNPPSPHPSSSHVVENPAAIIQRHVCCSHHPHCMQYKHQVHPQSMPYQDHEFSAFQPCRHNFAVVSRVRKFIATFLALSIVLTIALSAWGLYKVNHILPNSYTPAARLARAKAILFATTAAICFFAGSALAILGRSMIEALVAILVIVVAGGAYTREVDVWMGMR